MDVFMKSRFARWTVILLVFLNIGTLTLLWMQRAGRPGPPGRGPKTQEEAARFLKEELELSDAQFDIYLTLRDAHRDRSEVLRREMLDLRRNMMDALFQARPDTVQTRTLAHRIGSLQEALERQNFNHFMDLKALCGTEQESRLRLLLDEFFRQNQPPRPPGPDHRPPPPGPGDRHRPPPPRR